MEVSITSFKFSYPYDVSAQQYVYILVEFIIYAMMLTYFLFTWITSAWLALDGVNSKVASGYIASGLMKWRQLTL